MRVSLVLCLCVSTLAIKGSILNGLDAHIFYILPVGTQSVSWWLGCHDLTTLYRWSACKGRLIALVRVDLTDGFTLDTGHVCCWTSRWIGQLAWCAIQFQVFIYVIIHSAQKCTSTFEIYCINWGAMSYRRETPNTRPQIEPVCELLISRLQRNKG